ncbi:MAG: 30S ribosomal protein S3 [Elusimicrobia bacterium]|nr:30S ribosomal protein S3 [Elusimicrobiota bacterium]
MGQKVHPKGLRLGYSADWDSKWFSRRNMADLLEEDFRIRRFVKERLKFAAVSKITIERAGKYLKVNIFSARPGLVIGKRGADVESLKKEIEEISDKKTIVNIMEIKLPETNAQLVAEGIAMQLEKKGSYRRAMKKAIEKAMGSGALGIKVMVAGRLGGNEIARTEWLKEGRIPLQTFRAEIDYGFAESLTTMGIIGVKVWIFKKELFRKTEKEMVDEARLIEKPEDIVVKEEEKLVPEEEIVKEEEDNVISEESKI